MDTINMDVLCDDKKTILKHMRLTLFLMFSVVISSCSNNNNLKQDLAQLQSREINIPLDKMRHQTNGIDTLIANFTDSELKLVVYSDSSACSSCAIQKMYLWDSFIDEAKKYQGRLKFYFLFSPAEKSMKSLIFYLRASNIDYPIFIDREGVFAKGNPHLPKNPQLHTFLLDKDNKVILVGNPLNNPKIEEMYYKIVEEKLGKK